MCLRTLESVNSYESFTFATRRTSPGGSTLITVPNLRERALLAIEVTWRRDCTIIGATAVDCAAYVTVGKFPPFKYKTDPCSASSDLLLAPNF